MRGLWLRLKAWRRLDRDLEDELSLHLAMRGDTPDARRRFGNPTLIKEKTRELWTFRWIEEMGQDLRYAGRMLRKSPVFAATAILSLALGIGANTAIFSLMDALLLRALPVERPEQLVELSNPSYSYPAYEFFRDRNQVFSGVFATDGPGAMEVQVNADPERAQVELATGTYFPTLGVPAAIGRTFTADDDRTPGAHPVAVLSHRYWDRRFQRDPQIVGQAIRIRGVPFTVIGVAAPAFNGVRIGSPTDIWTPMTMQPQLMSGRDWLTRRPNSINTWLHIFARLKPGIEAAAALPSVRALYLQEQMDSHGGKIPESTLRALERAPFQLLPGGRGMSALRRNYTLPLKFLMAATGLVLLIACANLASLLLARSGARRREIGVRLSLGAARGRLIRQMLTESALLTICGAALGLLIAQWGSRVLLRSVSNGSTPVSLDVGIDWRLIGFMAAACGVTTLLFGLWPAVRATGVDVTPALKQGGAASGPDRAYAARLFMLVQVSLSVILLCGAGIFLRNLVNLRRIDLGIQTERLVQLDVDPFAAGYKAAAFPQICQRLLDRIAAIPGVRSATVSENGLFSGRDSSSNNVSYDVIGSHYFSTLGIRLLAGREFVPQDSGAASKVAIVNDAYARSIFPEGNAVGRKLNNWGAVWEIVGVAPDARAHGARPPVKRRFYVPVAQFQAEFPSVRFLIRTSADPDSVMGSLRQAVRAEDPLLGVLSVDTATVLIDRQLAVDRMLATLAGYFGVLALLVAAVGLYGSLTYQIVRRTKEIGIRLALGAVRRQIVWSVAAESLVLLLVGIVFGLIGAAGLSKWVASLLFEIKPTDPMSFAGAIGALILGAAPAALLPALRAARLDPARTLREE